jgi:pyruvate kinase
LNLSRTRIVCTIVPASDSEAMLKDLIHGGMRVARLNFSHGAHESHAATIRRIRAAAALTGEHIAILQDLQGPKIRTGALIGHTTVTLRDGAPFTITTEPVDGDATRVSTTYTPLPRDVKRGDQILLCDGGVELRVEKVAGSEVRTTVVHGGALAEHQGINLPRVALSTPALTAKDREDVAFGVEQGVDAIALSFVRRPEDVLELRDLVASLAPGYERGLIPVFAKIEKPEAVSRLDDILDVAQGVMVARGDLGVEMALEEVPLVQKRIIRAANLIGIPVITATQMLESMITSPRPTRAEVSDVANAILDGTDAVMLSAETAKGAYPLETVHVAQHVAQATERSGIPSLPADAPHPTHAHAVASAAHNLAMAAHVRLIVVYTRSGLTAQLISRERPAAPIIAYSPDEAVCRKLALWWGVVPLLSPRHDSTDDLLRWLDTHLREQDLARKDDRVVLVGAMPLVGTVRTNFVKLHTVGELDDLPRARL